ncbi:hypothetical protein ACFW4K_26870 [Nocardiopsis alba]|uniref:hypothetical protein n=1 Tax=Nocardiopsis alba TaxID=53437 RepID=UPI003671157C
MSRWQYHALRVPDRAWLDRDLPLSQVSVGPALSGPYTLKAQIAPEYEFLTADDGDLLLAEWGTLLVAERDDHIQGAAIITSTEITGATLSIEAAGITSLAAGALFESTKTWGGKTGGLTGNGVDPLDVVRYLWDWLQGRPDAGLGVTLGSTRTGYRLGAWHNARKVDEDGKMGPATEVNDPIAFDGPAGAKKPTAARGKAVYWQHSIGWWDKVEIGARMDELAKQVPFDYVETAAWTNADKTDVALGIRFGYPRVGRKLTAPVFIVGENCLEPVPIRRGLDSYANHVVGLGAGEGSKQLRASATRRDGRLRRTHTVESTNTTSLAALRSQVADTLNRARHLADIVSFTAIDHPNAPLGEYTVGDDVLVVTGPEWQPTRMWVRITALDIDAATDTVTVTCSRSDAWDNSGRSA